MEEAERELSEGRLLIQTHEAKIKSLQESVRDSEAKKRQLEESLDAINEEVATLRTAGKALESGDNIVTGLSYERQAKEDPHLSGIWSDCQHLTKLGCLNNACIYTHCSVNTQHAL